MHIDLFQNFSKRNTINKTTVHKGTVVVQWKNDTDITNPVLIGSFTAFNMTEVNYIACLGHFYYVNDYVILDGSRQEIHLEIDVLDSYKDSYMNCLCLTERTENGVKRFINDNQYVIRSDRIIQTKTAPHDIIAPHELNKDSYCYVLTVAGG